VSSIRRVGVIGLGIMGRPMALNLLKAGFELNVYTRTTSRADDVVRAGARAADSAEEVASRSDLVVTMVPDSADVVMVTKGPRGLFAGARPGLIVADMSTISPAVTRELAIEARDLGCQWLDAPVSGGEAGAIAASLTIMVGGDKDAFERARPVFEAMGRRITHMGSSGTGQTTKLCNQVLGAVNLLGAAEALVFGARAGLDLEKLHQALTGGAANSWAFEHLGRKMLDRDFAPAFMVRLLRKDLRLAGEVAREAGAPLLGAEVVEQLLRALDAHGHGDDGTQALVTVLESLSGAVVGRATA
jgi:2-hydroxy-3-oxopropionate reductase